METPERLALDFEADLEKINADPRLTAMGRTEAVTAAGKATLDKLERWHAPLRRGLEEHEREVRGKLAAAVARPKPTDVAGALADAIMRADIRRAAADLSDLEAETLFRLGDALTREALVEAPHVRVHNGSVSVRPFVSAETRDAVLLETAAAARPDLADQLYDVAETRGYLQSTVGTLEATVRDIAPAAIEPKVRILS